MEQEEKLYYFIEHKITHKWRGSLIKDWYTLNPHKAVKFEDKLKAEECCEENEMVTEHIFVDSTQEFI